MQLLLLSGRCVAQLCRVPLPATSWHLSTTGLKTTTMCLLSLLLFMRHVFTLSTVRGTAFHWPRSNIAVAVAKQNVTIKKQTLLFYLYGPLQASGCCW